MSRYFVNDEPVPILEFDGEQLDADGRAVQPNVIWIKAKMDVETRGKVSSELVTAGADNTPEMRLGMNQTALLIHNIVRWTGPDLGRVPCIPANIRKLDPTEPHIEKVLSAIGERNKPRPSPDPKSAAGANTSTNGTAHGSAPALRAIDLASHRGRSATSTPRSPLQSALDGHLSKSDDSTPTTSTS